MSLESIRSLIQADLEAMNSLICQELASDVSFINELLDYILSCGGKRIRPLLVLLIAKALNHKDQHHIALAAAIEMIHTATLLHDDVVDHATLRRGRETANSLWGNQASVLVGDFLYSRAFQIIVKLQKTDILTIFSNATNLIAEGEIMQLLNCHNPDTTEAAYFEVIQRKTAKLFEVAAQSATALSDYTDNEMLSMQQYGINLGIAYQLIDDALDYDASPLQTGKNIGNDLSEGKPTLPLIHALRTASPSQAILLHTAIKTGSTNKLDEIISIIESTESIEYTTRLAKQHAEAAKKALTFLSASPYRNALVELTEFVVERVY